MSAQHSSPSAGHAPGFRAIRFNMDWITRPLFGLILGGIALAVVFYGADAVAMLIALGLIFAALEWHRCVGERPRLPRRSRADRRDGRPGEAALLWPACSWPRSW